MSFAMRKAVFGVYRYTLSIRATKLWNATRCVTNSVDPDQMTRSASTLFAQAYRFENLG